MKQTREERLEAALRENLKRRKQQGRAREASPDDGNKNAPGALEPLEPDAPRR